MFSSTREGFFFAFKFWEQQAEKHINTCDTYTEKVEKNAQKKRKRTAQKILKRNIDEKECLRNKKMRRNWTIETKKVTSWWKHWATRGWKWKQAENTDRKLKRRGGLNK